MFPIFRLSLIKNKSYFSSINPNPKVLLVIFLTLATWASTVLGAEKLPIKVNKKEMLSLTMAELIFQLEDVAEVAAAKDGIKLMIIEQLRSAGHDARGGENLVFGKDESSTARFLLGGMVRDMDCIDRGYGTGRCQIEVNWSLLDKKIDKVVYKVRTRGASFNIREGNEVNGVKEMIRMAVNSLMSRPLFVEALRKKQGEKEVPHAPAYAAAEIQKCPAAKLTMPKAAQNVLDATVLIKTDSSFGSGVVISPDGYLFTAAHVLSSPKIKVIFQNKIEYEASVIRVDKRHDVALLKIKSTDLPCLSLETKEVNIGERVYAIGSPASQELSFSLTSGVISARRTWEDVSFLQTDASINPGNSGGPLVNEKGKVLGIVSWKLTGLEVEGISFGVPTEAALKFLAIELAHESNPELADSKYEFDQGPQTEVKEDTPDAVISLTPEADRRRELAQQKKATKEKEKQERKEARSKWRKDLKLRREKAPLWYPAGRWGGLALMGVGAVGVVASWGYVKSNDALTEKQYKTSNIINIVSWVSIPVGGALMLTSRLLLPKLEVKSPIEDKKSARLGVDLRFGLTGNGFLLEGRF